jgi:hypothetical protein
MIVVVLIDDQNSVVDTGGQNSVVDTGKLSPLTPVAKYTAGAVDSGGKVVTAINVNLGEGVNHRYIWS